MTTTRLRATLVGLVAAVPLVLGLAWPTAAQAHSLDSSTISLHLGEETDEARLSVAAATLDDVLGTDLADGGLTAAERSEQLRTAVAYLADHLGVVGADGEAWTETWGQATVAEVEGIASLTVEVGLDPDGADPASLLISYDGVMEADPAHEAVVVLTDTAGEVSTAGVLTADDDTLALGSAEEDATGALDLVGLGFHHVLEGADHLLFLVALLLPAPVLAVAGRWRVLRRTRGTVVHVVAVATAFTVGHSLTLAASTWGWVVVPSAPVEVLVALSVAVAAVHAWRPVLRHGEVLVAGGFGLVHGLAFAGILADLGLAGRASVASLLAFNVGVELAQLAVVAAVLPSLLLLARTRAYPAVRVAGAALALVAALAWGADRVGLLADPLAGVEAAAVANLPWLAVGLGGLALAALLTGAARQPREVGPTPGWRRWRAAA